MFKKCVKCNEPVIKYKGKLLKFCRTHTIKKLQNHIKASKRYFFNKIAITK